MSQHHLTVQGGYKASVSTERVEGGTCKEGLVLSLSAFHRKLWRRVQVDAWDP